MTAAPMLQTPISGEIIQSSTPDGCRYLFRVPMSPRPGVLPLVTVHGISRNAHEHMTRLSDVAERAGALLVAPVFGPERRGYQRLRVPERGISTDLDLIRILDEVRNVTGFDTTRFNLLGFSGGGQFAHRFAMVYPQRVARLLPVAAGWYTWPDEQNAFPVGFGPSEDESPLIPDLERFAAIPTLVAVGTRDTSLGGALRHDKSTDRVQGRDRVTRARRWVKAVRRMARRGDMACFIRLEMLPRTGHSFAEAMGPGGLEDLTLGFFYGSNGDLGPA